MPNTTGDHHDLIAWMNGEFLPESEAKVSIFDDGFIRGDAVFDAARTFGGRLFQIEEHVDRFIASCEAVQLPLAQDRAELIRLGHEVVDRNRFALDRYGDFWLDYRITRGARRVSHSTGPITIVVCDPIPFRSRAPLYRDGVAVVTPSVRRTPPWAVSPRIKSHNYLNFVLADLEVKGSNPAAWPLLLDEYGNVAEGASSNLFIVRGQELCTPLEQFVLPGITRATVMKLAGDLGLSVREMNLDLRDVYLADEVFLTSTSLCLCGVGSVNGRPVRKGAFGPVTTRLLGAYGELAGIDVRAQYLSYL